MAHAFGNVRGEIQAPRRVITAHDIRQPGLENGNLTGIQGRHFGPVDVDADHLVARLGDAGARHQAYVACAMHGYSHWLFPG